MILTLGEGLITFIGTVGCGLLVYVWQDRKQSQEKFNDRLGNSVDELGKHVDLHGKSVIALETSIKHLDKTLDKHEKDLNYLKSKVR